VKMLPLYFDLLQEHRLANRLSERNRRSSGLRKRLKCHCIILHVAELLTYFQLSTKSPVKKVSRFPKIQHAKYSEPYWHWKLQVYLCYINIIEMAFGDLTFILVSWKSANYFKSNWEKGWTMSGDIYTINNTLIGARGSERGWETMLQAGKSPVRVRDEVDFFN
jgi:hypothetical protein